MSYSKTFELIKSDYKRYGSKVTNFNIFKSLIVGNHAFKFTFWLRMCSLKGFFFPISLIMYSYYSKKYGLKIPYTIKIGYGLYLGHGLNVVINDTAIIGNNCNISHFCTIGSNFDKAAIIGNNVYVGPSVCIVENVIIGNNVTIGAGSVVVKNIEENATVGGVPAKVLSYNNPGRFINNKW